MKYWEAMVKEIEHKAQTDEQNKLPSSMKKKESKKYYVGESAPGVYFTQREVESVRELLKSHTIAGAAQELGLSPRTVEFYVKNMKMKLNCSTKADLLKKVVKTDLKDFVK